MANEPPSRAGSEVIAVPATPPPLEEKHRSPSQPGEAQRVISTTPPMSAQAPTHRRDSSRAPDILSTPTTTRKNAAKDLPSLDHIEHAGPEELRRIATNLVKDLMDTRITAANARLQHHLLQLETSQAAERAEVESQLSRTQVDYLRVKQVKPHTRLAAQTSPAVQAPTVNEVMSQSMRDLESHCDTLEQLCDRLKREKELQAERIQSLTEHNSLLINRVRENREHLTRMREQSPVFPTPREAYTTPRRRYSRYHDDAPAHQPFAALIAADQILSQETASVPTTPTKSHAKRFKRGHTRASHSLSSIQTPKDRPTTSDGFLGSQLLLSAPGSQLVTESAERERHDRDSTISISDTDLNLARESLTQSQASSLAADMLRRNPAAYESQRQYQDAEKSSNLLQSKIFGNVKKPVNEPGSNKLKRHYGFDHTPPKTKRIRADEKIGLGIEA